MNTNLLAGALCAMLMAGILMVVSGFVKREIRPSVSKKQLQISKEVQGRCLRAGAGFMLVIIITRWPAMAFGAAVAGWFSSELFGGAKMRAGVIDRTEAIATWTEMLRDTLSAAHGLEAAISATAPIAPAAIQDEIRELAIRLQQSSLEKGLESLARDLAHPIGDLVCTALTLAAGGSARELGELLSTLAEAARDEASLRLKIDAGRSSSRTSVRMITFITIAMALGLPVLSGSYLKPYDSATGQLVLVMVVAVWGLAFVIIRSMSKFHEPERFFVKTDANTESAPA